MVDAQGQHGLGLNIHAVLIQARFDEDRCQMVAWLLGFALQDLQGQRLAFQFAQLQRRNQHASGLAGQQSDDPARRGLAAAIQGFQAVELTRVTHLETAFQRAHVRFAELRHIVCFQRQFDGFPGVEARAVNAGGQLRSLQRQGDQAQQQADQ